MSVWHQGRTVSPALAPSCEAKAAEVATAAPSTHSRQGWQGCGGGGAPFRALLSAMASSLEATASQLAAPGKGLLASDESTGTIGKRLEKAGFENNEVKRPRELQLARRRRESEILPRQRRRRRPPPTTAAA